MKSFVFCTRPRPHLLVLVIFLFVLGVSRAQTTTPANCKVGFQRLIEYENANDIIESIGGKGYIVAGGGMIAQMVCTDTSGNLVWFKAYGNSGTNAFYRVIRTADNNYAAVGWCGFNPTHAADILIVKIDPNGNLLWSKCYGAGTQYGEFGRAIAQTADGGYVIAADYNANAAVVQPLYMKLDANGNLLWSTLLGIQGTGEALGVVAQGALITGAGIIASTAYTTFNDGYLVKLHDTDGSLVWTKKIESEGRSNQVTNLYLKNNQYVVDMYNSDTYTTGNAEPLVFMCDTSGRLVYAQNCIIPGLFNDQIYWRTNSANDGGFIANLSELQTNTAPRLIKISSDGAIQWIDNFSTYYSQVMQSPIQDARGDFVTVGHVYQYYGDYSNMLFVKTDATGNPGDITGACKVTQIPGTTNPVGIQITDMPNLWKSPLGDGQISGFPITATLGTGTLTITSPCADMSCHSLTITGNDSLCDISAIVTYHATRQPGCEMPVQWSVDPSFADILSSTDSTVQLQFKMEGASRLSGSITRTCDVIDSSLAIHILQPSIPITLGGDTAFCKGPNASLDAGPGFQSYLWNTGATTEKIGIPSSGSYWVHASASGHCSSQDTVDVQVYELPAVNLGPNGYLCQNTTKTFDAGGPYTAYLWQDGSTREQFTASSPGVYWVLVSDVHQCKNADTVQILGIVDTPAHFLPATAVICMDDVLKLSPTGEWSSYLWSDQSTESTIVITEDGTYWLQVTDSLGCKGMDTVMAVSKACRLDMYFPNAFTPNQDGHNDIFRPFVYGNLVSFDLQVYDRRGVKVFETKDATQGWDGNYMGKILGTNTFVWYAIYQYSGRHQKPQMQKGTVLLIR